MALTKDFNETVKNRLQRSEGFRRALLREAVGCMISGDLETGKSVLRKYINGTIGFVKLGADLGRSPKVLMRMFSPIAIPETLHPETTALKWTRPSGSGDLAQNQNRPQ